MINVKIAYKHSNDNPYFNNTLLDFYNTDKFSDFFNHTVYLVDFEEKSIEITKILGPIIHAFQMEIFSDHEDDYSVILTSREKKNICLYKVELIQILNTLKEILSDIPDLK